VTICLMVKGEVVQAVASIWDDAIRLRRVEIAKACYNFLNSECNHFSILGKWPLFYSSPSCFSSDDQVITLRWSTMAPYTMHASLVSQGLGSLCYQNWAQEITIAGRIPKPARTIESVATEIKGEAGKET